MPGDVIAHKTGDEIIGVVVAGLQAELYVDACIIAGSLEEGGAELLCQEVVGVALIDQDIALPAAVAQQGARVVVGPGRPVVAEIASECLMAPGHFHGRHDGCEGRDGFVGVLVFERDGERAVAAHGMAKDALPAHIRAVDRPGDELGQLVDDIGVHPIVLGPWLLRRIDIKPGPFAEVVLVGGVGHVVAAWARVRADDNDPVLRRVGLEAGFRRDVLPCAGEAREIGQDGHGLRFGLGRCVDRDFHGAAQFSAFMFVDSLVAAEARPIRFNLQNVVSSRYLSRFCCRKRLVNMHGIVRSGLTRPSRH